MREDSGSGVEPPATVDDSPCLCNFWPAMVVGRTFFAVRLRDFCSCLPLIMWHNKLSGNLKIYENRSIATAADRARVACSASLDPDAGGGLAAEEPKLS